jgi:hypothetical protein
MKKLMLSVVAAAMLAAGSASAADMRVKAPAPPPPPPSPWDVAFGGAIMSDYNFRGISQSNKSPAVFAYVEPRYTVNNWQLYAGVGGLSIGFPNNAAAEIDFYGGVRPTFGPVTFDLGVWYYYYPGGRTFDGSSRAECTNLPSWWQYNNGFCNVAKKNFSFFEAYGKATYTLNDNFSFGGAIYYNPNWLNTGAEGWYAYGTAKYTAPAMASGIGVYVSGEVGHYWLGRTDQFYGYYQLPDYTNWSVGIGFTYKVFTLDLRYYDTDLTRANCNGLTGDHTAKVSGGSLVSKWCDATFIAKLSFDATLNAVK